MTSSDLPPRQAARLSLNGTISPNEGERLPSLNRLNNPSIPVGSFEDKNSPRLVNTNAGFFSGGDGTANAAIGVGVNAKAVTFSLGSVLSTELLSSIETKRSDYNVDESILDNAKELVDRVTDKLQTVGREKSIISYYNKQVSSLEQRNTSDTVQSISPILPRFFEDRSHLIFFSTEKKVILPFFQNPIIEERRLVNYTTTTQQGQVPQVNYNFTNLSEIKVTFKLNYMHVADILAKEKLEINAFSFYGNALTDKDKSYNDVTNFFNRKPGQQSQQSSNYVLGKYTKLLGEEKEYYINKLNEDIASRERLLSNLNLNPNSNKERIKDLLLLNNFPNTYVPQDLSISKAQSLCLMWIYLIKSWVGPAGTGIGFGLEQVAKNIEDSINAARLREGNATQSLDNQPATRKIIILKHGPAFFYIPCVLVSYEIKETNGTPYDVGTVMANSYDITLNLMGKPSDFGLAFRNAASNKIPAGIGRTDIFF